MAALPSLNNVMSCCCAEEEDSDEKMMLCSHKLRVDSYTYESWNHQNQASASAQDLSFSSRVDDSWWQVDLLSGRGLDYELLSWELNFIYGVHLVNWLDDMVFSGSVSVADLFWNNAPCHSKTCAINWAGRWTPYNRVPIFKYSLSRRHKSDIEWLFGEVFPKMAFS
jgi:hypothetical protein